LVRKYQISHVWHSMVGRMAGDKPITNRTLSFKNGKLGTHMRTYKAGLIHHCPEAENTTTEKRSVNKLVFLQLHNISSTWFI